MMHKIIMANYIIVRCIMQKVLSVFHGTLWKSKEQTYLNSISIYLLMKLSSYT